MLILVRGCSVLGVLGSLGLVICIFCLVFAFVIFVFGTGVITFFVRLVRRGRLWGIVGRFCRAGLFIIL